MRDEKGKPRPDLNRLKSPSDWKGRIAQGIRKKNRKGEWPKGQRESEETFEVD